ncbi:hypothetical protein [Streptomyces sp. cmx-4-9]
MVWFAQTNGHGLVPVAGIVLRALTCLVARPAASCPRPTDPACQDATRAA